MAHPLVLWLPFAVAWSVVMFGANAVLGADVPFQRSVIDNGYYQYADCKAVGDIDGDQLPDVVIGGGLALNWYRYPAWTKTAIATANSEFTTDMQMGDVDGDGDRDIIVPDGASGNNLLWFENPRPAGNPATASWTRHEIGSMGANCHDVEAGDLNGDGKLDVVARQMGGPVVIFFQNSPTSWTKVTLTAGSAGEGTCLGDVDQDGDLDVVQNGYWLQNPLPGGNPLTGSAWTKRTINSGWPARVAVTTGDMNNDGRLDILLAHSESTGRMAWYEAPADPINGTWAEHVIDASVDYAHTFKTADINLDGKLDVVFAEMAQSSRKRVGFYLNGGGGLGWQLQVLSTSGSHNIRVADFGNDGDLDIVGANWQGGPIEWWENLAGPPPDTTPPALEDTTGSSATTVLVLFSKPVAAAAAQTPGNYIINNGVTVSAAALSPDMLTLTLTTSTLNTGSYILTVNNVTDLATPPNMIASNSQAPFEFMAIVVPPPYQQWREAQFTTAELADPTISCATCDPDSDGLENLMEYGLGLDPKSPDGPGRPHARIEGVALVLTYTRLKSATDVTFSLAAAANAQGPWSTNNLVEQLIGDNGILETYEVTCPMQPADTAGYIRLSIEK